MSLLLPFKILASRVSGAPFARGSVGLDWEHKDVLAPGDRLLSSRLLDDGLQPQYGRCPTGHELKTWGPFHSAHEEVVVSLGDAVFAHNLPLDRRRRFRYEGQVDLSGMRGAFLGINLPCVDEAAYLSNTAIGNHAHWLTRAIPLLAGYAAISRLDRLPRLWTGDAPPPPAMRRALEALGIEQSRIFHGRCHVRQALVSMHSYPHAYRAPGREMYLSKAAFSWTRQALAGLRRSRSGTPRRLYISRGPARWRRLRNEDCVIAALAAQGFTAVAMDGMSLDEQAALFCGAEIIVAPHGAALANLVFAREGLTLVEIMPSGYDHMLWYYPLACYLQADYRYMVADAFPLSGDAKSGRADMSVDIPTLLSLC